MENGTATYLMTGLVCDELFVDGVTGEVVMSIERQMRDLDDIVLVIDIDCAIQVVK